MALDLSMLEPWLQPLPDAEGPCGKDLEYDLEFLELMRVAEGKPETQFSAAEPPNWRDVREQSEALMARTRDLRIAMLWLRAMVNLTGFSAAAPGLRLLNTLLADFPDNVHPMPDPSDGDEYARANVLATLPKSDGLLGDLRQCLLFKLRGAGDVRLRSIAVAAGLLPANADETPYTQGQVRQSPAESQEKPPLGLEVGAVNEVPHDWGWIGIGAPEKLGIALSRGWIALGNAFCRQKHGDQHMLALQGGTQFGLQFVQHLQARCVQHVQLPGQHGLNQSIFAAKVVVHGCQVDLCGGRDLAHGQRVKAARDEQGFSRIQYAGLGVCHCLTSGGFSLAQLGLPMMCTIVSNGRLIDGRIVCQLDDPRLRVRL